MFRLEGPSEVVREAVPHELVPVFWAITALGSAKILVIGLSLAYWNWTDRRRELLTVIAVAFVALAVTLSLKHWFAMPRPPGDLQRYPIDPSPHGFPSGHAIAATVVYGGALVATKAYRDLRIAAGVAALVFAIGLSRVVLGVHYLGDILAGFAVGLAALTVVALAVRSERGVTIAFVLAAVCSIPALFVASGDPDVALAIGGSIGGAAGSRRITARGFESTIQRGLFNAAGVALVLGGIAAGELVEGALLAGVVVNFALALGIVLLPLGLVWLDGPPSSASDSLHR